MTKRCSTSTPTGNPIFELKPFGKKGKEILALDADPRDFSVWVASKEQVAHVSADDAVPPNQIPYDFKKKKEHLRDIALYVDVIAPEIAFTDPSEGALTNNGRPTLGVSFTDIGEGVDPATFRFEVKDGGPVDCVVDPQDESATCVPMRTLPDGLLEVSATVQDLNGNLSAQAQVGFTVDTTPPIISFDSPLEGAILNTATPSIKLLYSDSVSGVDTSTLLVQSTSGNPTVSCDPGPSSATCTPTFPEGDVTLTATIADVAGNVSLSAQVSFTVDTLAPIISFTSPAEGSTVNTDLPTLEFSLSDSGVGVDTVTLAIQANGAPLAVTCDFDIPSPPCTPTTPLPEGDNTLEATIQDLAGNPSTPTALSFTIQLTVPGFPVLIPSETIQYGWEPP